MDHATQVLMGLFIVFVAAQVGAEIAARLQMPTVVGEIAMGILIGPTALHWVTVTEPLEVMAEIGAILLLFAVGLETRIGDLKRVGWVAGFVGVAGVVLPFILGAGWALLAGFPGPKAMFVAAAFVATSAGITARVLKELGVLSRLESRVILGAAVIDDILAMLLLGVVTSLQGGQGIHVVKLLVIMAQAVGFIAAIALFGTRLMRKSSPLLDAPINPLSPLTLSLAGCLGLAVAAATLGLAGIIGAFLAGMVAAESDQRDILERQIQPIMAFIVPFFFVVTGTKVALNELTNVSALGLVLLVTVLAVIGKLVGCGLGALSMGKRSALVVGVGMVPRGEVGIIIASLGLQADVFSPSMYGVIIAMSLLTSVLAPPPLKWLLARLPPGEPSPYASEPSRLAGVDETGYG